MEIVIVGCVGIIWYLLSRGLMYDGNMSSKMNRLGHTYTSITAETTYSWKYATCKKIILSRFSITNPYFRYLSYVILLLSIFIFRDYTPANELKYISIADEAIRNNTWFTFYNHGEVYADKPPLFFWLIMLARSIAGEHYMWIMGLFSLLPAIGVMAIMDKWFNMSATRHNPVISNLLLLTTAMFAGATLVIRMDMLMIFFIVLSLYTFFRIYNDEHAKIEERLLPVYIFLAIFTKGPMGFIVPVVSIVGFLMVKKQIKTIGRYLGWKQFGILLGLCGVWFLMIYLEGGSEYLNNILFKQTVGRGVNSFRHQEPMWFYFPRMLWSFAPWTLLYVVLIGQGIRRKMFDTDIKKFFAVIITVNIIVLSLISSKLDIYMLPVYPFIVYLCSALLHDNRSPWVKTAIALPAGAFILVFPVFFVVKPHLSYEINNVLNYTGIAILSVAGVMSLYMLSKNKIQNAITSTGYGMLSMLFVCSFTLPEFAKHIGFGDMAAAAQEKAKMETIDSYAYYKFETVSNIDVYLGQELECIGSITQLDSLDRLSRKTILFVKYSETCREEEFKDWINARDAGYTQGKYRWYVLGGKESCGIAGCLVTDHYIPHICDKTHTLPQY